MSGALVLGSVIVVFALAPEEMLPVVFFAQPKRVLGPEPVKVWLRGGVEDHP